MDIHIILLYGCEVLGFNNTDVLERIQLKICPTSVGARVNHELFHDRRGTRYIYPVKLDIKLGMAPYWAKILHGKDNKLSCLLFKLILNLSNERTFIN